jgi:hypothetical protein
MPIFSVGILDSKTWAPSKIGTIFFILLSKFSCAQPANKQIEQKKAQINTQILDLIFPSFTLRAPSSYQLYILKGNLPK